MIAISSIVSVLIWPIWITANYVFIQEIMMNTWLLPPRHVNVCNQTMRRKKRRSKSCRNSSHDSLPMLPKQNRQRPVKNKWKKFSWMTLNLPAGWIRLFVLIRKRNCSEMHWKSASWHRATITKNRCLKTSVLWQKWVKKLPWLVLTVSVKPPLWKHWSVNWPQNPAM